ncbi:unnamed protein product [Protopolystoma xenopodis]|uniref:Uncharacterized protein n=1 Tax=Protopolystoma xenopodis TaxID=117903 RepID=A0A448WXT8_9PLAT|nr:unnamed protein product [Protopolystoma xenopodis]
MTQRAGRLPSKSRVCACLFRLPRAAVWYVGSCVSVGRRASHRPTSGSARSQFTRGPGLRGRDDRRVSASARLDHRVDWASGCAAPRPETTDARTRGRAVRCILPTHRQTPAFLDGACTPEPPLASDPNSRTHTHTHTHVTLYVQTSLSSASPAQTTWVSVCWGERQSHREVGLGGVTSQEGSGQDWEQSESRERVTRVGPRLALLCPPSGVKCLCCRSSGPLWVYRWGGGSSDSTATNPPSEGMSQPWSVGLRDGVRRNIVARLNTSKAKWAASNS